MRAVYKRIIANARTEALRRGFRRGERDVPNLQETIAFLARPVLPQDSDALRNAPS